MRKTFGTGKIIRFAVIVAVIAALCVCMCVGVSADTVASGTFGADGDNLKWVLDDEGTLTISGEGAMEEWNSASKVPWHNYKADIKSVTLGDSVTSVGSWAFYDFVNLSSVLIGSNITYIGDYSFYGCSALTIVEIPENTQSIGTQAFYNCTALTDVTIGDKVTSIGNYAFRNCINLTNLAMGKAVESIGESAFYDCKNLSAVVIPDNVTSIGEWAFYGCRSMKNLTLGKGLTQICDYTFYYCTSLKCVTIPSGVTSVGNSSFRYCTDLTDIVLGGVVNISEYAFANCTALSSVEFPCGMVSIGSYSFAQCTALTSVAISDTVTTIGKSAFRGCTSISDIFLPDSISDIGSTAFYMCDNLTKITLCSRDAVFGTNVFDSTHADFVVRGYVGSTAEAYASANNHAFEALDEATGENSAVIAVSSGEAAAGEIIKVEIMLKNNPGVAAMCLNVNYDSDVFTLESVEDGGLLGNIFHSNNLAATPYILCWANGTATENFTANGIKATLIFRVSDDADIGEYDFTVGFNKTDILDVNIKPVCFAASGGTAYIIQRLPGDASGDGITDLTDLMYFLRYIGQWIEFDEKKVKTGALDLNLDGKINPIDAVILARHIAKWSGYETLPYNPS